MKLKPTESRLRTDELTHARELQTTYVSRMNNEGPRHDLPAPSAERPMLYTTSLIVKRARPSLGHRKF